MQLESTTSKFTITFEKPELKDILSALSDGMTYRYDLVNKFSEPSEKDIAEKHMKDKIRYEHLSEKLCKFLKDY